MRSFIIRLWRGELPPAGTFWGAHVAVLALGMLLFQWLSTVLSMDAQPLVGLPLGLIFVGYNTIACVGVVRSTRKRDKKRWPQVVMILASVLLWLLSCWVPLYFLGRPLIAL
ncbi:MAG: hypothetical protein JXM79_05630 [Sedimentisphaerales bacterium]|nr:hypothetical protein [Sedimentisphaerales bacterium]